MEELTAREPLPEDREAILAAREHALTECGRGVEDAAAALFDWRYRESPHGSCARLVERAGQVLGFVAGVRHQVLLRGEPCFWVEMTDLFSAAGAGEGLARTRGLLAAVDAFCEAFGGHAPEAHPVMYGLPTRRTQRLGLARLGLEVLRSENRLVAQPEALRPGAAAGIEVEEVERFPEGVLGLFERVAPQHEAILTRDARHLDWRFFEHPERTYRAALARRGGSIEGYAVYRVGALDGESRTGILADWLAAPEPGGASQALLAWAAELARADGVATLRTTFPDTTPEWLAFQRAGFRAAGSDDYLAFRSFQRPYIMSWLFKNWHYTLGDTARG